MKLFPIWVASIKNCVRITKRQTDNKIEEISLNKFAEFVDGSYTPYRDNFCFQTPINSSTYCNHELTRILRFAV